MMGSIIRLFFSLFVILPSCLVVGLSTTTSSKPRCVLVAGATGRLGSLVVRELLSLNDNPNATQPVVNVRALVRDKAKAKSLLPPEDDSLRYVKCDLSKDEDIDAACVDADAVIWCASGVSDTSSLIDKVLGLFKLKFKPKSTIEIAAVSKLGSIFSKGARRGLVDGGPKILLCSSAAVSRPSWSPEKKAKYPGAADIPIVRLNPVNILGLKLEGEEALRKSGADYVIARPCGLVSTDRWPRGRPFFSQGDIAVGRTTREDAARVLVDTMMSTASTGKTFEFFAVPGYPYPRDLGLQFSRLRADPSDGSLLELPDSAIEASYNLMQQLVPGETMEPQKLAMGQRYEELDKNIQGRLGERGKEVAPLTIQN